MNFPGFLVRLVEGAEAPNLYLLIPVCAFYYLFKEGVYYFKNLLFF